MFKIILLGNTHKNYFLYTLLIQVEQYASFLIDLDQPGIFVT